MIGLILGILKFGGLLLSGVFGVYSLLVKFNGENDKITKSGRHALIIIIITSTMVGVLSAAIEIYRDSVRERTTLEAQAKEMLDTAKRTEKMISEINRSLQPISCLSISRWINVPTDHFRLKNYISRFETELPNALALLTSTGQFPGYNGGTFDKGNNPVNINFDRSALLAPDKSKEALAYWVFIAADITLDFFRSPIDEKSYTSIPGDFINNSDLRIELRSWLGDYGSNNSHEMTYNLKEKQFKLSVNYSACDPDPDPGYRINTGKILSIQDLAGSQLFVRLLNGVYSGDANKVDRYLPEIRRSFGLDILILNFGKGREFWIMSKEFKQLQTKDGFPLYVYTFPQTVDALNELTLKARMRHNPSFQQTTFGGS